MSSRCLLPNTSLCTNLWGIGQGYVIIPTFFVRPFRPAVAPDPSFLSSISDILSELPTSNS